MSDFVSYPYTKDETSKDKFKTLVGFIMKRPLFVTKSEHYFFVASTITLATLALITITLVTLTLILEVLS